MSDIHMEISIPADNDGYVLFQCPMCGDYFKIKPIDYEDDGVLDLHCPNCGLCGEDYFTDDVIELAHAMATNVAMDLIYNEMKKLERKSKGGMVTFKAGNKPTPEPETPVRAGVEALATTSFYCCKRYAKIKPLLRITGCYCPFCGVKEYEIE